MKRSLLALVLLFSTHTAWASGVKLERLEDFDTGRHALGVNVQVRVRGGCPADPEALRSTYESTLAIKGFRVADLKDSHLEFAVSIVGFAISETRNCGIRVLSMVRQIPRMRILRLSPDSESTRYRLWQAENLVTGAAADLPSLLEEQARLDVMAFQQAFQGMPR